MQEDAPLAMLETDRGATRVVEPQRMRRWTGSFALLLLLVLAAPPVAADVVVDDPYKVKAAFLRHFAHYVTWPPETFRDDKVPWCIGILGTDPFGTLLEKTLLGRTERGRAFTVRRAEVPDELQACHIVYITYRAPEQRRAALARFKGKPVLTVGESPEFLQEGGMILLHVDGRVRMSINLDQARAASLEVQTPMLEVATAVLENGELHSVR